MYSGKTKIINKTGLHARPASDFTNLAKKYKSDITVTNLDNPAENPANAKSVFAILALGMGLGTNIEVAASGIDETEAVNALIALIDNGFGE